MSRWSEHIVALSGLRTVRNWRSSATVAPLARLRARRDLALRLYDQLDLFLTQADARLNRPQTSNNPATQLAPQFAGADWSWRPASWQLARRPDAIAPLLNNSRFGDDLQVFHDCPLNQIALRQQRQTGTEKNGKGKAPFAIGLDVLQFQGSFLSLVIDLPQSALSGLSRHNIVALAARVTSDAPNIRIHGRLNVEHGPNSEQITQALEAKDPEDPSLLSCEFDLGFTEINEKRLSKAWVDLLFEAPAMTAYSLHDLSFARLPRAAI